MQDNDNQRIEPAAFVPGNKASASSETLTNRDQTAQDGPKKPAFQWLLIAGLGLVVLVVLFLPGLQKTPPSESSLEPIAAEISTPAPVLAEPEETPWADAQLLKARRDAQEILAELLGVQQRLESLEVEQWAEEEFAAIKQLAVTGDTLYKERQFEESLQHYTDALDSALQLDAAIPEYAQDYFKQGQDFLTANQTAKAIEALELSALLVADDETLSLLQQAQVRDELLALIEQSNSLARDDARLEQAKEKLAEAESLDSNYAPLKNLIDEIELKILDRDFRQRMSAGYSALGNSQYEQAITAFEQASRLKPQAQAPVEALQQVEAAKLNTERQADLDKALSLEADENWQSALALYKELLGNDPSLTAAQLGKLRSEARYGLDTEIKEILAKPLALQSDSKWQNASRALADARKIINAGSRLEEQISQLQELLTRARTPVVLKLNSDGLTDVEIYRVGKLGTFVEQAMNLNPGKYVIVGRRNGYQDVRVELAIDGSKAEIQVPVICTVAI